MKKFLLLCAALLILTASTPNISPIYIPQVSYPKLAQRWAMEGEVIYSLRIGKDGKPKTISVLKVSSPIFIPHADSIARGITFAPQQNEINYTLPVIFKLKK